MTEHEERADELEREADDMARRTEHLEDEISDAREDWQAKQRDPRVPGATGDPEEGAGEGAAGQVQAGEGEVREAADPAGADAGDRAERADADAR